MQLKCSLSTGFHPNKVHIKNIYNVLEGNMVGLGDANWLRTNQQCLQTPRILLWLGKNLLML